MTEVLLKVKWKPRVPLLVVNSLDMLHGTVLCYSNQDLNFAGYRPGSNESLKNSGNNLNTSFNVSMLFDSSFPNDDLQFNILFEPCYGIMVLFVLR